jgi:hypothetical protein
VLEESRRRSANPLTRKITTDSSPAAISQAAVGLVTTPICWPIIVAVTMNGSEVAWRSPAITACRRPRTDP